MTRDALTISVDNTISATHDALALVWDALNHGQQKQLLKDTRVKTLLIRYGVIDDA